MLLWICGLRWVVRHIVCLFVCCGKRKNRREKKTVNQKKERGEKKKRSGIKKEKEKKKEKKKKREKTCFHCLATKKESGDCDAREREREKERKGGVIESIESTMTDDLEPTRICSDKKTQTKTTNSREGVGCGVVLSPIIVFRTNRYGK